MDADPNWVESFICAIESKPCLYDKSDNGYCNKDIKNKAWSEVNETVIPEWENLSQQDKKNQR